jgi:hypothetical protein
MIPAKLSHPGSSQIESLGETGIVERPRNGSYKDSMPGAADSLGVSLQVNQNASEIQAPPRTLYS